MQSPSIKRLDELFSAEPDRLSRLSFGVAGLYFDWSKTHLDREVIEQSIARGEKMGFAAARDALFSGGIVNPSEGRPATHVAERGSGAPDDVDLATARRTRMRALVDAIEAGLGNVADTAMRRNWHNATERLCTMIRQNGGRGNW